MKHRGYLLYFSLILMFGPIELSNGQSSPLDDSRLRRNMKELDRLEKIYQASDMGFSDDKFWIESKRVANRTGLSVVHAVMKRSHEWHKGEERGLAFVPLVDLLPRAATVNLLREYQDSGTKAERFWAGEFLAEIYMPGTDETVRRYSAVR